MPLDEPKYDAKFSGDDPKKGCVVDKINEFRLVIKDKTKTVEERRFALRFLIHCVEDMHMPMHVGDNKDKGGGEVDRPARRFCLVRLTGQFLRVTSAGIPVTPYRTGAPASGLRCGLPTHSVASPVSGSPRQCAFGRAPLAAPTSSLRSPQLWIDHLADYFSMRP